MQRKFYLHAYPDSAIIDEVQAVARPTSIFTKDWDNPIRTIPTIQFFPELKELIEGEAAIRQYIETLKPRPLASERKKIASIKTKIETPKPAEAKPVKEEEPHLATTKPVEDSKPVKKEEPVKVEVAPTNEQVIKQVRSQLTTELKKAKKPRKTVRGKQADKQ